MPAVLHGTGRDSPVAPGQGAAGIRRYRFDGDDFILRVLQRCTLPGRATPLPGEWRQPSSFVDIDSRRIRAPDRIAMPMRRELGAPRDVSHHILRALLYQLLVEVSQNRQRIRRQRGKRATHRPRRAPAHSLPLWTCIFVACDRWPNNTAEVLDVTANHLQSSRPEHDGRNRQRCHPPADRFSNPGACLLHTSERIAAIALRPRIPRARRTSTASSSEWPGMTPRAFRLQVKKVPLFPRKVDLKANPRLILEWTGLRAAIVAAVSNATGVRSRMTQPSPAGLRTPAAPADLARSCESGQREVTMDFAHGMSHVRPLLALLLLLAPHREPRRERFPSNPTVRQRHEARRGRPDPPSPRRDRRFPLEQHHGRHRRAGRPGRRLGRPPLLRPGGHRADSPVDRQACALCSQEALALRSQRRQRLRSGMRSRWRRSLRTTRRAR